MGGIGCGVARLERGTVSLELLERSSHRLIVIHQTFIKRFLAYSGSGTLQSEPLQSGKSHTIAQSNAEYADEYIESRCLGRS